MRGVTETNPHGVYDHHMLVIAVVDTVTLRVIHYTSEVADDMTDSAQTSSSIFGNFASFGGGDGERTVAVIKEEDIKIDPTTEKVELLNYPPQGTRFEIIYAPQKAVKRARSRLGEQKYGILSNNCECLVNWAYTNKEVSNQSRKGLLEGVFGAVSGAIDGYKKEGLGGAAKEAIIRGTQKYQKYRESRP